MAENNPALWTVIEDPKSGKEYYYNSETGVTTWTKPDCLKPQAAPGVPAMGTFQGSTFGPMGTMGRGTAQGTMAGRGTFGQFGTMASTFAGGTMGLQTGLRSDLQTFNMSATSGTTMDGRKKTDQKGPSRALPTELIQDIDKFQLNTYAEAFFTRHRKGVFKRKVPVSEMLEWQKEPLQSSLLKLRRDLVDEAKRCFNSILTYCGDREPIVVQTPTKVAQNLLGGGIFIPEIRDEIYCQLCKQTCNNPGLDSNYKAWELMAFCVGTFPPTKDFESYLLSYLEQHARQDDEIGGVALFCQQRLQRTLIDGARATIPIALEIESVKEQKPIIIRVCFLDRTFKTITVESFTTIRELLFIVSRKIKLREDRVPEFGLYELLSDGDTNVLKYEDKVLDVLGAWEMEELKKEREEDRKLWEENEDLSAKALREMQKEREKQKEEAALRGKGTGKDGKKLLVFKRKIFLPSQEDNFRDAVTINLHYNQAIHDVFMGHHPVTEDDAVKLAALRVLATFGQEAPSELTDLESFLPKDLWPKREKKEWEEKILLEHIQLPTMDALKAKMKYLDHTRKWHCFGSSFYEVDQDQFDELPTNLILAVNATGVHLLDVETKDLVASYEYAEICSWAYSTTTFTLLIGNMVNQQRIIFGAEKGAEISQICTEYVNYLVEDVEGTPGEQEALDELNDFDEQLEI